MDFLGHHISQCSIEANTSKVDSILHWPTPKNTTEVHSFLGLVCYISAFLPNLAEHTRILTPLTMKDAQKKFPEWTIAHQNAFDSIKHLIISRECLTTIDHMSLGENKIFVTCDTSDWHTSGILSFGPTWETAHPVAFDLTQLNGTKHNYPVHKKELLSIICALKKWHADLLGSPIYVYTDHRILQNFDMQKDLSHRHLCWQELMSQYEINITYILGKDNTAADALSCVPASAFPGEEEASFANWSVNGVL
jgi:hypothetical protein